MVDIVYEKVANFCGMNSIPCVIVGAKTDLQQRCVPLRSAASAPRSARINCLHVRFSSQQIQAGGSNRGRRARQTPSRRVGRDEREEQCERWCVPLPPARCRRRTNTPARFSLPVMIGTFAAQPRCSSSVWRRLRRPRQIATTTNPQPASASSCDVA